MNTKHVWMIALLFALNAVAAGLHTLPSQQLEESEWQGPLMETGARSNNSSSGCGYDVNHTTLMAYAGMYMYDNDPFASWISTHCDLIGTPMLITVAINNTSGTVASTNFTYNGSTTGFNGNFNLSAGTLSAGNYSFAASLYYYDNASGWTHVETDSTNITVMAYTSTPCGFQASSATVYTYSNYSGYDVGEDFEGVIATYCAIYNATMMLDWTLHDDDNNQSIDSGSYNWTAMQTQEVHYVTSTALSTASVGNYSFHVEYSWYNNSSTSVEVLDTDSDSFWVYNYTSGGGNQSSGCGSDPIYATVYAYSDFYAYDLGEDFDGTISTYCAMTNESMMLDWVLHDDDNNQSIDSGSFNWTAQQTSEQHNVTSTSLATAAEGNYSFTVEFSWYNTTSMAWEVLDSDTDGFFVMNMSSGGGNHSSGPSCSVYAWSQSYAYNIGDNFTGEVDSYCSLNNETLMIEWAIVNTDTNATVDAGNVTWTTTMFSETQNISSTALANQNAGNYSFVAMLSWYNASTMIWTTLDSDSDAFFIWNGSTGGGGNHSTGCGSDLAYTMVMTYAASTYNIGDTLYGAIDTVCPVSGQSFMMDWSVYSLDSGYNLTQSTFSWTANNSTHYHDVEVANLSEGNWSLTATLYHYNATSMSYTMVDHSMANFSVFATTQPSIDGSVEVSMTTSNYASGDTVSWLIESSELVMNEDYHVEWNLVDTMTNTTLLVGNASWTAYNNLSGEQGNMSSLSDGYYCLDASLYQHVDGYAYWVDFDYACFTVGSTSSGNHSDAFMDIDFDYEITQIDDDTIGLAYTVNNSGDWAGSFYYQAYLNPGDIIVDHVYGNVSISGMGVYSDSLTYDIDELVDGAEICIEMAFVNSNGTTEAEGNECLTIDIDDGSNTGNETGNNTGGNTTVDTDGDGVFDQDDLCPNTTAGVMVDEDGCEVITAPTDSDADGVADADDLCPNTPAGTSVDATGCEEVDPVDNNTGGNTTDNNTGNANVAPTITNVSITPLLPEMGDTLTCAFTASDDNGDTVAGTYVWSVNGTVVADVSNTLSDGFAVGDTVTCTVLVTDGTDSAEQTATTVILPEGTNDVVDELEESGLLPSVGTIGTLVAIAFGVGLTRRQDD